jgi:hypothetical protein
MILHRGWCVARSPGLTGRRQAIVALTSSTLNTKDAHETRPMARAMVLLLPDRNEGRTNMLSFRSTMTPMMATLHIQKNTAVTVPGAILPGPITRRVMTDMRMIDLLGGIQIWSGWPQD